jgi:hypothetical protein
VPQPGIAEVSDGALLDGDINGRWFIAQDYAGLSLPSAMQKAKFYYGQED